MSTQAPQRPLRATANRRPALAVSASLAALVWLTAAPAQAQFRVQAEAIAGQPFGVGVLSVQAPLGVPLSEPAEGQVSLVERNGRAFYPAYESRPATQAIRALIGTRRRLKVFFLFTGDAPLELTLSAGQPIRQTVVPRAGNRQAIFSEWWREFARADSADPYPQVHNYLAATLARRLDVRMPEQRLSLATLTGTLGGEFNLLSGGESTRLAVAQQALLDSASVDQPLDVDLPGAPPVAEELPLPDVDPQVAIEPIALRVPAECFYVHAGSFPNFLWFQHRLEAWGGNLRNLVSEQSVDYNLNGRFQRQIGLKESALAPVLGPAVIADVAIIGTDTFLRDGAAMGILFQARNSTALSFDLDRQRREALQAAPATEEKLTIAGRSVSLISTPDNALRSFYVSDGDFHLVATSRALVERFLATAGGAGQPAGAGSLGALAEFRLARTRVPLDRGDTIFIYLSRAMFANLLSPQYQIELVRRLRSSVEMELVALAQLLAASERQPAGSLAELIAAGALPPWFGRHSDGSQLTLEGGALADSVRGVRSGFIPIPDMPAGKITRSEAAMYEKAVGDAIRNWGEMDPVIVSILRTDSAQAGMEHVALDVQAAPLSPRTYQFLSQWLGPALEQRLAPVAGNLVDVQASLRGGNLMQTGDHTLFLGMQDSVAADLGQPDQPLVNALRTMTGQSPLRGYVGAWPQPGLLSLLGANANLPTDAAGYSRMFTGVWRRVIGPFTVLSFHRDVLEQATPQLRLEPSQHPAQLRAHAADLAGTNLATWINQQGYKSARRMSLANTHLAAVLSEQFGVPGDEALGAAGKVLDAELVDPLGGEYRYIVNRAGLREWVSDKLEPAPAGAGDYRFPALTWIRGADVEGRLESGQLVLHAELEMPIRVEAPAAPGTPKSSVKPPQSVPPPAAKTQPPAGKLQPPAAKLQPRPGTIQPPAATAQPAEAPAVQPLPPPVPQPPPGARVQGRPGQALLRGLLDRLAVPPGGAVSPQPVTPATDELPPPPPPAGPVAPPAAAPKSPAPAPGPPAAAPKSPPPAPGPPAAGE